MRLATSSTLDGRTRAVRVEDEALVDLQLPDLARCLSVGQRLVTEIARLGRCDNLVVAETDAGRA